MSRLLNPNAISFTPSSSLHPLNQIIPVLPSPLHIDLPFLPHHLLQAPFYDHYQNQNQQIFYEFPPPPPPPTKIFDYELVGTLDVYNHGYCLKSKPNAGRAKCKKQPPPPPPPHPHPHPFPHRRQVHSGTNSRKHWRRKSDVHGGGGEASATGYAVQIPKTLKNRSTQSSSDKLDSIQHGGTKTSVMIKNIPNRYCRDMLLELLIDHCKEQNGMVIKSEEKEEDLKEKDLCSAFDFVYLPIDFETKCNKGYAFVNFTNPNGVWRLYNFLNNYKWDLFNSKKICEVTYARIQGKDALVKHFTRSTFACEKDEFLPVYFNPYLDGSAQDESVEMVTVGTRLQSSSSQQIQRNEKDDEQTRAQIKI